VNVFRVEPNPNKLQQGEYIDETPTKSFTAMKKAARSSLAYAYEEKVPLVRKSLSMASALAG